MVRECPLLLVLGGGGLVLRGGADVVEEEIDAIEVQAAPSGVDGMMAEEEIHELLKVGSAKHHSLFSKLFSSSDQGALPQ